MRTMLLAALAAGVLGCAPLMKGWIREALEDLKCHLECVLADTTGAISTPVTFVWSQAILTGQTFNPLTDWQYETPDFEGMVEIYSRATAVGLLETISSAGETLKQESPVQAGGTAGVTPSDLNTKAVVGRTAPLQKIRVFYRNPTGGTITVDGQVVLSPLGGSRGRGRARGRVRGRR